MSRLYVPSKPLHMVSYQLEGRFDEKPEWTGVDPFWHGPAQQTPWGARQGGRPFAQGVDRWMPEAVVFRASWNLFCFRDTPQGPVLHSTYEDFLDELADRGRKFVWDWHDGRLSYLISRDKAPRWPMLYGVITTMEEAVTGIDWLGNWAAESYDVFLDWLSRRPKLQAATLGFELMNEPMAYNEAAKIAARTAGASATTFWSKKVDHIEMLVTKLKSAYPTRFIIAPMAGANTQISQYVQALLPDRGGKSALNAIRDVVGRDWLVWGMHRYPSFDRVARDLEEHKRLFVNDFRALNDDPVAVTEFNIAGEWWMPFDYRPTSSSIEWRSFFNGRYKDWVSADLYWPGKPEYWLTWWPFSNVSQNNLGNIYADGEVGDHQRQSRAIWMAFFNRYGTDDRLFGPLSQQKGIRGPKIITLSRTSAVRPDESDQFFDGWAFNGLPAWQVSANVDMALYWGGRYGTVHEILDGAYYSTVIGGDGKTVVLDAQNVSYRRNHYWLGKGGGVVRLGAGAHQVMSEGGPTRVYTCAQGYAAINLPYGWDNEIIIDPDVRKVWIYGFDRARGDKISFKGVFRDLAHLRRHAVVTPNTRWIKNNDLTITLPNGGEVLFIHGGNQLSRIHETVLEWTNGWYAPGWSEPVDFTPADFDVMGPPLRSYQPGGGATRFDREGQPIFGPFDRDGASLIGLFDRDGNTLITGGISSQRPPARTSGPTISPNGGVAGTVFLISPVVYIGSQPIDVVRSLTLNGVDVTDQLVGDTFTPFAPGALVYTETGTNAYGSSGPHSAAVAVSAPILAPTIVEPARISPASGPVGTTFTVTPAQVSGTAPISRTGALSQDGTVVASRSNGEPFTFTSTQRGPLQWSGEARNTAGVANEAAAAAVTHPLQAHFDSGAILIFLSDDAVTLNGEGRVTALENLGGAGSMFNAAIIGPALALTSHCLQLTGATGNYIQMANTADLVGVDLCWVMQTAWPNANRLFGSTGTDPAADIRFNTNTSGNILEMRRFSGGTTTVTFSPRSVLNTTKSLYRIGFGATQATLHQNGVQIRSAAHSFPNFPVRNLGQAGDNSNPFIGLMGDVFGVLRSHPNAAQALADARAYVAAKQGIALT